MDIYYSSYCCCSFSKSSLTLCDPMDCHTPGFPVLHNFPEFSQTQAHRVSDAIQPSHPLSPPSPPALNLSQHLVSHNLNYLMEISLVVQWLRIHLPVQGTWVPSLVWEDPTCCEATKPVHHNY